MFAFLMGVNTRSILRRPTTSLQFWRCSARRLLPFRSAEPGSLVFDDVGEIKVPPHPKFEAWQLLLPDVLVICIPGGGEPAMVLSS